jgi:hypothetical protein
MLYFTTEKRQWRDNMDAHKTFKFWLENCYFDEATRDELRKILDNPKEIEERFYKDLEFGTGGLRGIIGAGTNSMNKYTVRKASQGLANYLAKQGENVKKKGVVIAFDSRNKSSEFALEAARVFAGNGITAYLFDGLRPTPELSFAVRFLEAAAGVVITASHNPKEYNGYKVYGEDGAQLSLEGSNAVLEEINSIPDITSVNLMDEEEAKKSGILKIIGTEIDRKSLPIRNGKASLITGIRIKFPIDYAAFFWYSILSRVSAMAFACWIMHTKAVLAKKFLVPRNNGDFNPLLSTVSLMTDSIRALVEYRSFQSCDPLGTCVNQRMSSSM